MVLPFLPPPSNSSSDKAVLKSSLRLLCLQSTFELGLFRVGVGYCLSPEEAEAEGQREGGASRESWELEGPSSPLK